MFPMDPFSPDPSNDPEGFLAGVAARRRALGLPLAPVAGPGHGGGSRSPRAA